MLSQKKRAYITLAIFVTTVGLVGSTTWSQGASSSLKDCLAILPKDGDVGTWARTETYRHYPGEKLRDHIDVGADLFYEYDLIRVVVQDYRSGATEATVEIYQFGSPADAFGVLSVNRGPLGLTLAPELEGRVYEGFLEFWRGPFYVVVRGGGQGLRGQGTLISFGRFIASKVDKQGERPALLSVLPKDDRLTESERYIRGPASLKRVFPERKLPDMNKQTKAAVAMYKAGELHYELMVVEYPGEEASKAAFDEYLAQLDPSKVHSSGENVLTLKEETLHYVGLRLCKSRLFFVFDIDSPERASATVEELCWE